MNVSVCHLEPLQRAVVAVQHEHGQRCELGRAVPAVAAVHHHRRLPRLQPVCDPHCSREQQLGGAGGRGQGDAFKHQPYSVGCRVIKGSCNRAEGSYKGSCNRAKGFLPGCRVIKG